MLCTEDDSMFNFRAQTNPVSKIAEQKRVVLCHELFINETSDDLLILFEMVLLVTTINSLKETYFIRNCEQM